MFTLLNKFGTIVNMARPKIIRLDDGHVILKNFTPERSKQLEELVLGNVSVPEGTQVRIEEEKIKVVNPNDLTESAVGWFKKDNKYFTIVIKYNPEFKTCLVTEIKPAGTDKGFVYNNFKIECANLDLI